MMKYNIRLSFFTRTSELIEDTEDIFQSVVRSPYIQKYNEFDSLQSKHNIRISLFSTWRIQKLPTLEKTTQVVSREKRLWNAHIIY